ncbi:MAG: hypothetical protein ISS70_09290 [Phycisphaerae bacterium]|nr:hypothetical protein [Phycisphaerae bacterium]
MAVRTLASAAEVDSAPAPDRVEARDLARAEVEVWTPAEGQVKSKMDQVEVVGRVAVRASDPVEGQSKMDQIEVRDLAAVPVWALAGRVAGSVPTDVRM